MKHGNPETGLIREQERYILILEEQLDVCKEQIRVQEILIEEQNQALALFAEAFREDFLTTSLSYQLQAVRRELAGFRSGEACQKLRTDYEGIIREKDIAELLDMVVSLKNRNAELGEKGKTAQFSVT